MLRYFKSGADQQRYIRLAYGDTVGFAAREFEIEIGGE